jgi:hypothetical protein
VSGEAEFGAAHNLMDGSGSGRLNGDFFLNENTVHDDGQRDVLTGSAGRDWFLGNLDGDGGSRDKITDTHGNETRTDIDVS